MDAVVKDVENQRGRVMVISEEHEGGKRLAAVGGVGAMLRYKI